MKICKVKPDYSTCSACVDIQRMYNVVDDCSKCKSNTDTYELLQIGNLYKEMIQMYDHDYCYECSGYGDDYYVDDDGELQCRCETCPFNNWNDEDYNE